MNTSHRELLIKLDAACNAASKTGVRFKGKFKDGRDALIWYQDCGDVLPGYDDQDNRFEALSGKVTINNNFIGYSQANRLLAENSENISQFRLDHDMAYLAAIGIDVATIEILE